jgi:hypothetical protein
MIRQYPLTPAAGKRLIAKAAARHPLVDRVLRKGRLVIVAGTTNGYVAEEILANLGQGVGFSRQHFYRGITVSPDMIARGVEGAVTTAHEFPGDVVIDKGVWKRTQTVYDVVEELGEDDVIIKGANALDVGAGQAASFVDHRDCGPVGVILPAVLGRHVKLLVPVGLEKRIPGNLMHLSQRLAAVGGKGPRLCHLPGEVLTELEAIAQLTDAHAEIVGAGGVAGAEGCVWLSVEGGSEEMSQVDALMRTALAEPGFVLGA